MARVRCPCGREYTIADRHVGRRLKCTACSQMFVAKAAAGPTPKPTRAPAQQAGPPGRSMRIGELAIAHGFISHEQLDACLEYQETIHRLPGEDDQRLGRILVSKRLLTPAQLKELLGKQQAGAAAVAAAAIDITAPAKRSAPVTEEQREALRRIVEDAARKQTEKERRAARTAAIPGPLRRVRFQHVLLVMLLAVGALVVVKLLPPPASQRAFYAYLKSCDEAAAAPDPTLAFADFGLAVRSFSDVAFLPGADYDYGPELQALADQTQLKSWAELLERVTMPDPKRDALALLVPHLPGSLGPRDVRSLRIHLRPAECDLVFRRRGMAVFLEGRYRFVLLKVDSPAWECGWKVAAFEPAAARKKK